MHKQITFFGSSPFSVPVLQQLIDAGVVVEVITKADKPTGRHLTLTPNPVKVLAQKHNLPVVATPSAGTIGLVAAYGKIIPQSTLDIFSGQIYNIHPSLLPKYRGPSPLQQQILDGVTETGVSIIQLDAQMDHGPIVVQEIDTVRAKDTWLTLGERLFAKGVNMFLSSDLTDRKPQDDSQATYTKIITRQNGFVPWEEFKPLTLETKLKAFTNWPGVWTITSSGKRLKLLSIYPTIQVQLEGRMPQAWDELRDL